MVLWKTTVVLIASGLTGSGIVVFTRSDEPPAQVAAVSEGSTPNVPTDESLEQQNTHARFAAQRPFACLFGNKR